MHLIDEIRTLNFEYEALTRETEDLVEMLESDTLSVVAFNRANARVRVNKAQIENLAARILFLEDSVEGLA